MPVNISPPRFYRHRNRNRDSGGRKNEETSSTQRETSRVSRNDKAESLYIEKQLSIHRSYLEQKNNEYVKKKAEDSANLIILLGVVIIMVMIICRFQRSRK